MPVESFIPVIVALVQIVKQFAIDAKWMPLIAVVLGIIFAGISLGFEAGSIVTGIIWGLSAVGLYSGGKSLGRKLGLARKTV